MRETENDREIDKKNDASNASSMHRCKKCKIELF